MSKDCTHQAGVIDGKVCLVLIASGRYRNCRGCELGTKAIQALKEKPTPRES